MTCPPVLMSRKELEALPEYSRSLPTSTTIGKKWRRRVPGNGWLLGEYAVDPWPGMVAVHWSEIIVGEEMVLEAVAESILSLFTNTELAQDEPIGPTTQANKSLAP